MLKIIDYLPQYAAHFRTLNLEWISQYFKVEPHDTEMLDDPEGYILSKGGFVFFAQHEGEIVGTVALLKESDEVYELAKMAVMPNRQGLGIGKALVNKCIEAAKNLGCKKLYLESNKILKSALHIYESLGFEEVEIGETPYIRANYRAEMYF